MTSELCSGSVRCCCWHFIIVFREICNYKSIDHKETYFTGRASSWGC